MLRVLREAAVGLLLAVEQVVDRAVRAGAVAGREQRGGDLVEVARPDLVVDVGRVREPLAPHPRHARRGDVGAAVGLVLVGGERHHRHVVGGAEAARGLGPALERAEVAVPAAGVAIRGPVEAALERAAGGVARGGGAAAEAEHERHAPALDAVERGAAGLHDVAARRRVVGPVHAEVGAQVGPAVARAEVAARGAPEGRRGDERRRGLRVARDQRGAGAAAGVVVAAVRERRVRERVERQLLAGARRELHVDQQRVARRIGHVGLDDLVARRRVDLAVGQRARVGQRDRVARTLALALGERLPVGDDELQVAERRRVEIGVVDLGQHAVVERVPDLALGRLGGAVAVLVGLGPQRLLARRPRCGRGGRRRRARQQAQHEKQSPPHRQPPLPRRRPQETTWHCVGREHAPTSRSAPAHFDLQLVTPRTRSARRVVACVSRIPSPPALAS